MDISKKIIFLLLLLILLLFTTSVSALSDEAYVFAHTNRTIPVVGANLWTNITFDQEATDIIFNIAHVSTDDTNTTFTISDSGIYSVAYDLDIEDTSAAASNIDVAARMIFTNGTEIVGSVFETDITKQGIEVELSHDFLIDCQAGDQFVFQFVAEDADVQISTHGTFGVHPESATIEMNKIADTYDEDFWFYVVLLLVPLILIILSKMTEDNWFKLLAGFGLLPFGIYIIQETSLPNLSGTYIKEILFFIIIGVGAYLVLKGGYDLIKESG